MEPIKEDNMERTEAGERDNKLSPEELEAVAGGSDLNRDNCLFVSTGEMEYIDLGFGPAWHTRCSATCWHIFRNFACRCMRTDRCINRWHIVTPNGSPLPREMHRRWYD